MEKKSVILLSGGLDSLVSLGVAKEEFNIELALTFDYGQNPVSQEINTSNKIADYYGIEHRVVKLPFLKEITNNAFVGKNGELPSENIGSKDSAKAVWVPNRNALFLNIAGVYAEARNYTHIIFGANKTEGKTFPDNTIEFVERINCMFLFSTMNKVKVFAPLINYTKDDIVRIALEKKVPLELAYSCYSGGEKNCGKCESCQDLMQAIKNNGAVKYIERLF